MKAVDSLNAIIKHLDESSVNGLKEMLKRLSGAEWFTSRVSVCGLFASVYAKTTSEDVKVELRVLFKSLVEDETPMVRRSAALSLGDLTNVVSKEAVISDMIPLFNKLVSDEQDSVRLLAVMCAQNVGKVLSTEEEVRETAD